MKMNSLSRIFKSFENIQSTDCVLGDITEGLASEEGNALVRIWLLDQGDRCRQCPFKSECLQQDCFQLVSSHGSSLSGCDWQNIDGRFSRLPRGVRKIGHIGTGVEVLIPCIGEDDTWIVEPTWAAQEKITSFAGQPLFFEGQVIGVLAVFSRVTLNEEDVNILKIFSTQAAAAIANAQAFEQIKYLKEKLEQENEYLRQEVVQVSQFKGIIGNSLPLNKVLEQIELVAPADSTVLITGESGTGKELIARGIHEKSRRADKPMIKVNCASIPRELFESEFFGHVKGAFTGALRDRLGRFELADGGTLFLDEVGEIPLDLQSKLLRVLQEGQFERIGDEKTIRTNVRIIAATNRDLKTVIKEGGFRQDLYYRLSVFPIELPSLRERLDDVPLLADFFLTQFSERYGIRKPLMKKKHISQLKSYDWPGNIRELQNFIERALIISQHGGLNFDLNSNENVEVKVNIAEDTAEILTEPELRAFERTNIARALEECNWKVGGSGGAAEMLRMKSTTLASRIKAMNIERS
jgi:transcriptional regulator with GAF, ATPase, and Fis domain